MNVCMYVCVCVSVCMFMCVKLSHSICVCVYICIYVCGCIHGEYTCVCSHIYTYTHTPITVQLKQRQSLSAIWLQLRGRWQHTVFKWPIGSFERNMPNTDIVTPPHCPDYDRQIWTVRGGRIHA